MRIEISGTIFYLNIRKTLTLSPTEISLKLSKAWSPANKSVWKRSTPWWLREFSNL
jgi:hypothetical protein